MLNPIKSMALPNRIVNKKILEKFFSRNIDKTQKEQLNIADAHFVWAMNYLILSFMAGKELKSPLTEAVLAYYSFFHCAYGLLCLDLRKKRTIQIKHRVLMK